jgi:adenylate kinase
MSKKNKKILFFGPVASGKDTQTFLLAKKYCLPVIAMGNLLREQAEQKTQLAKKLFSYLKSGNLVPDYLVLKIVQKRLAKKDSKAGFILDGFPRDLVQARSLEKITKLDYVFELKLSNQEVLKRVADRRICHCGATYHLKFKPPQRKDICDKCGKRLFIRDDDQPAVIKKRLQIYQQNIKALRRFYQKQKNYYLIDARPSIEEIHKKIVSKIDPESSSG